MIAVMSDNFIDIDVHSRPLVAGVEHVEVRLDTGSGSGSVYGLDQLVKGCVNGGAIEIRCYQYTVLYQVKKLTELVVVI